MHRQVLFPTNMPEPISAEKLETFVNDYLKEDLKDLEHQLNLRNGEIMEFVQLKNMIESIKEHLQDGFKTQMNIGGNFFMQAKVPKTDRILVNIGKNVYMDFTLDEALTFIDFQLRVLNKEADVIREESIRKRADIKLALMCIGTKKQMLPAGDAS